MALIKHGAAIAEIRGSIAGATFARNRSGAYIRNRTKPINPATAAQQTVRGILAALQDYWTLTLTVAQRETWNDFAAAAVMKNRLGESIALTGFNQFQRVNYFKSAAAESLLDAPPPLPPECDPPILTVTADTVAGYQITDVSPTAGAGEILQYRWTIALSQAVNFYKGPYQEKGYLVGPAVGAILLNAVAAIGDRFFLEYRRMDADGRLSFARTVTTDCIA